MRGVQQGEENVRRLDVYIRELTAQERGLPARDGRPNLTVIADACGFDRGVFYSNQKAKLLLDEAHRRLGLDAGAPAPLTAYDEAQLREESKSRTDTRSKSLEEEVLRLRVEVASLRAENTKYRAIRELLVNTGRLP